MRDWDDRPLFPGRQVDAPIVVDLGPDYRDWIERIHDFFGPAEDGPPASEARTRARQLALRPGAPVGGVEPAGGTGLPGPPGDPGGLDTSTAGSSATRWRPSGPTDRARRRARRAAL